MAKSKKNSKKTPAKAASKSALPEGPLLQHIRPKDERNAVPMTDAALVLDKGMLNPEPPKQSTPEQKPKPVPADSKPNHTTETPVYESSSAPGATVHKKRRKGFMRVVGVHFVLALVAGAGYWYLVLRDPISGQVNQNLISKVARIAVLPNDEVPAVTTVVDQNKVNQEFLRNAREGDKVLLYFQAGKAVVYRPSTDQIVNIGPLETPKPRVFIRSGTSANYVAAVTERVSRSNDFVVASQDESFRKNYEKTLVIDVTGTRPDVARRLAELLNATVASLPEGESKPDADMLVITGRNFQP